MEERCVICGRIIPEGRQVCPICNDEFDFAGWLGEEFRKRGIKQRQLSRMAGMSPTTISKYINGHEQPAFKMFFRILDALGKRFVITDK